MAEEGRKTTGADEALTKADFNVLGGKIEAMEADLYKKLADPIKPLTEQITQLNLSVQATAKLAKGAMDMGVEQQDDIRALQADTETQAEKLAILSNRQQFFNLKFRGLQDKVEVVRLIEVVSGLSDLLKIKERTAPIITQDYRIGCPNMPTRPQPRDVVITFADINMKNRILDMTKDTGYLYKEERIQVFKDLSPEALAKKRELKEILAILRDVNLRHRWASPIKLQLLYKGKSYFIRSEEEGFEILQSLGIATPMARERASAKHKLVLQSPPSQASKKSHKNVGR